jgi:hypothetical protein
MDRIATLPSSMSGRFARSNNSKLSLPSTTALPTTTSSSSSSSSSSMSKALGNESVQTCSDVYVPFNYAMSNASNGNNDRINERNFFQKAYNCILAFESSTVDYSSTPRVLKSSSSKKRNIDILSNDKEDNLVVQRTITSSSPTDIIDILSDDDDDEPSTKFSSPMASAKSSSPTDIIDLLSDDDDETLAKSSSPTETIELRSCDGDDDYDSSNSNDQCSISSYSSSDSVDDYEDKEYNDNEYDGGGKVGGYTNYCNVFQDPTTSNCSCMTHDNYNRWTGPIFVASSVYQPNGIPIDRVTIPRCDKYVLLKDFAASLMREHDGYQTPHGYATIDYVIFVMSQLSTSTPFAMIMSLLCTSVSKGVSVGIWGTNDPGVNPMLCPTFRVINAMANILPHSGINYGNRGFPFGCFNARTTCAHDDNGHCLAWTIQEAEFIAFLLTILGFVCGMMGIPIMIFDMGGAGSRRLYSSLNLALRLFQGGKYQGIMDQYFHIFPHGTHASNVLVRRRGPWRTEEIQVSSCVI